jgi:hypothetical protein
MSTSLRTLAEALKSLSKHPDRPIIDYWRTIQGTNVGFHGDPKSGAGIPIAGPPVLTGGSSSGNPLLKPLLAKYPQKTFIGDAIRKKNFPLSTINFIEKFVGKDNDEIEARIAKMDKILDDNNDKIIEKLVNEIDSYEIRYQIKGWGSKLRKPIRYNKDKKKFELSNDFDLSLIKPEHIDDMINGQSDMEDAVNKLNDAYGDADKLMSVMNGFMVDYDNKHQKYHFTLSDFAASVFQNVQIGNEAAKSQMIGTIGSHFMMPHAGVSVLYQMMKLEGVAGTLRGSPDSGFAKDAGYEMTKEDISAVFAKDGIDYESMKDSIGDMYAMNQAVLRRKGIETESIVRGMGGELAGVGGSFDSSAQLASELNELGVSMRFMNRPISGFTEGGNAVFDGWTVRTEIPVEATLSAYTGLRIQKDGYKFERETLVIGAASLAFSPDQITLVEEKKKYSLDDVSRIIKKAKSENEDINIFLFS